jgi:hypothetical protein
MELRFKTENIAEATHLAKELELALRQHGIPPTAISLKPSSAENMDIGSVLSLSLQVINQIVGTVGAIATVAGCIQQILDKYNRAVVVDHDGAREELQPRMSRTRIESALSPRPKQKRRSGE